MANLADSSLWDLGRLAALEKVRPEMQQYFIERNFDGRPNTAWVGGRNLSASVTASGASRSKLPSLARGASSMSAAL